MFADFAQMNHKHAASANQAEASFSCAHPADCASAASICRILDAIFVASILFILGVLGFTVLVRVLLVCSLLVISLLAVLLIMKQLNMRMQRKPV